MTGSIRLTLMAWLMTVCGFLAGAAMAQPADLHRLVLALAEGGFSEREGAIAALAATGDPAVVRVLDALAAGDLHSRIDGGALVIAEKAPGRTYVLSDPLTGADRGTATKR